MTETHDLQEKAPSEVLSTQNGAATEEAGNYGMVSILVAALRDNPICRGLNEDELLSIAEEAIEQNKVSEAEWLARKVSFLKGEEYDPHAVVQGAEAARGEEGEKKEKFQLDDIIVSERAQIESREDLDPILRAHQAWMDTVLNPNSKIAGGRANLSGCNLAGMNLEGVDLRAANLKGADLSGANLSLANLSTADLSDANLTAANLQGARLRKALLNNAQLMGANLNKADLRRAELKGADFYEAVLTDLLVDQEIKVLPRAAATKEVPKEENEVLEAAPQGEEGEEEETISSNTFVFEAPEEEEFSAEADDE